MLKSKLFKSLVVAGLITAISVPVFAAGQTEQVQPTMRDKVEKILSEGDTDARRPMPLRRGTPLTPEQRAERDAARLAWMEMTPQQKFEQRQKWHDEFLSKLPAEKREAIEKREAEARAKWASMSEEQKQDALKDMFRGPRGGNFRGLHCGWGPGYGRHHGEGRYDRDSHYDRYHHDGHCDWGDECPFYNEDK